MVDRIERPDDVEERVLMFYGHCGELFDIIRNHAIETAAVVSEVPVLRKEQHRIARNIRALKTIEPRFWPKTSQEAVSEVRTEMDEEEDVDWEARAKSAERHLSQERANHDRIVEAMKSSAYQRGVIDGEIQATRKLGRTT